MSVETAPAVVERAEGRTGIRGIILAAGGGTRMRSATADDPKCLLRLGGLSILERQVRALRGAGIDDIAVVVGCRADRVRRIAGGGLHYVENTRFAQTNSLYSLWLARPLLLDGFVVLNCDVLFHPQLLVDLLTARCDAAVLVAHGGDGDTLGDEEMKVKVRRGRVIDFSKTMPPEDADGENVGMAKFGAASARALVRQIDRLVTEGHTRDWAPRAFAEFARHNSLYAISTRGYPWIEIDFPEDYERARTEVLPAIERIPLPFTAPPPLAAADTASASDADAWAALAAVAEGEDAPAAAKP